MGTVVIILKKYIWDCKLRKTLPDVNDAIGRIVGELDVMIDCSKSLKHNIEYSGLGNIIANRPKVSNFKKKKNGRLNPFQFSYFFYC